MKITRLFFNFIVLILTGSWNKWEDIEAPRAVSTRMLTAQEPSIPLKPTSNVVVQVLPPSIMSSSRITREVQDSRTRAVRTSSSICLKTSRKESSSSSEAGRSSRSSAETIIKAGRRRIIRDSPRLSSRQQRTHKRSNVQGKVTSRATTSNSNTPTKE